MLYIMFTYPSIIILYEVTSLWAFTVSEPVSYMPPNIAGQFHKRLLHGKIRIRLPSIPYNNIIVVT